MALACIFGAAKPYPNNDVQGNTGNRRHHLWAGLGTSKLDVLNRTFGIGAGSLGSMSIPLDGRAVILGYQLAASRGLPTGAAVFLRRQRAGLVGWCLCSEPPP